MVAFAYVFVLEYVVVFVPNTFTYTQFPPTWGTRWGRLPRLTYVFAFAYVNVYVFVYTHKYILS